MPSTDGKKATKNWPFWLMAFLVLLVLAGFGTVIANQWRGESQTLNSPQSGQTTANDQVGENSEAQNNAASNKPDDAPVSILPTEPGGVTVLEKQAEIDTSTDLAGIAPIAQGADLPTGFAMDLGSAEAFLELTRRFATIAETNGAENFVRLEPRAVLRETVSGLEARLLVGPFESEAAVKEACAILILDPTIACIAAPFEGELISRQ